MSGLTGVRSLTTLPVVTLGGDAVAHVKDTVFDTSAGRIESFTLTGRTLLSGPLPRILPWPAVHCLGHRAVMVRDTGALCDLQLSAARREPGRRCARCRRVPWNGSPHGNGDDGRVP
ncbi:PRC-barrel domain-containing protein, partial [Streptomyces sp. NPDC004976]